MEGKTGKKTAMPGRLKARTRKLFSRVPLLGWLFGSLCAVVLEHLLGDPLADVLGLPKIPVLFGFIIMLKKPVLIPSATLYGLLIYILPIGAIGRLSAPLTNRLAALLSNLSMRFSVVIHLGLLYATLHMWAGISDYRVLMLRLTLIAVMLTLSLNVINGYMGEFSCSHPGFMALGAYSASVFTVVLFVDDKPFLQDKRRLSGHHLPGIHVYRQESHREP
jgi:branched-chain amino acid transport system permease protein